jgi:hypothetical protein
MTARSGPSLTDARRSELGWGRLTLRLPVETLDLLAVLADERGQSRAELVAGLVEAAGAAAK